MPEKIASTIPLVAKSKELSERLEHEESSLINILSGETDALYVPGAAGQEIVAFNGTDKIYRVLVENMSEGALTLTPLGLVLYANRRFARLLRAPLENIIGSDIFRWFAPGGRKVIQALLQNEAADNIHEELNLAIVDGTQVPVYISVSRFALDEIDVVVCMVVTDLTERKRYEAVLDKEKLVRSIMEQAADGIVICDKSGQILHASKQAKKYYAKNLHGQQFRHAFPLHNLDGTTFYPIDAIDSEYNQSVETLLNYNGQDFNLLVSVGHLKSPDKEVIGSIITLTDITELKAAEIELQENAKQLTEALTIARIGYWEYEYSSDEFILNDQYYLLHKTTAEEAGGYRLSRDEFIRRYISPDYASLIIKNINSAAESDEANQSAVTESRILSKEGEKIWVEVRSKILRDSEGNTTHLIGIVQDINDRKLAEMNLLESERRFRTMFLQAPLGIALIDSNNGNINEVNPRFAEIAGRSMEEITKISWLEITHPDDVQKDLNNMALMNSGKIHGFHMEKRYLQPDGKVIWINMTISPLKVDDNEYPHHLCMIQDISERKLSEARIKYLNHVLAVLSGISALIVRVTEREELFRESCNIAIDKGGFRLAMIVMVDHNTMQPLSIISAGDHQGPLKAVKKSLLSGDGLQKGMIMQAIREKKAVISNDARIDPDILYGSRFAKAGINAIAAIPLIIAGEAVGAIALYTEEIDFFHEAEMKLLIELAGDIAFAIDHINKQERLNYLAYYDILTGFANRTLFLDRVEQYMHSAANGGHRLAIALIELERFSNINDSVGRFAGEELLRQAAACLVNFTKDANLLAHIDTDRFALVVPEVKSNSNLVNLVENMLTTFAENSFLLNGAEFRISIKVGVALFPEDGDDTDSLFKNAEAALNKAKAKGERILFYKTEMNEAVAGKLAMESHLRQAIENEEFVLHYQPKVNLISGRITGAEALIRWNDPRTGLVPPGKFIPILEESGLINEVGRWALHKVLEDNLRWRVAGLSHVRIAVNVSPLQLRNINFIDEIREVVSLDEHAADSLELEITENVIMEDVKLSIARLQEIRAMGVTVAVDDFGTGFSSLNYLSKLPIDTLKIDRAFVKEMNTSGGMALVSTIIILAHALNLKVVAEGVETEEQRSQLLSLNCDEMQGFLFSKPVPVEIFETRFLAPHAQMHEEVKK